MAEYFVDLGADFAVHSCLTADKGTGVGSLQNLIYGWGGVTKLAALDTVYLKGVCRMDRFVLLDLDADVTGWDVGDAVEDNGAGATEWTGKVTMLNYTADNSKILVQLDSSYDYSSITTASGIKCTGETPETAGITSKALQPITMDEDLTPGVGGQYGNYIWIKGTASDWSMDGTRAEFDGNSAGGACFAIDDVDYYGLEMLEIYGFDTVFDQIGSSEYATWLLLDCYVHNNTTVDDNVLAALWIGCRSSGNTGIGFGNQNSQCTLLACQSDGNGAYGGYNLAAADECLFYENTTYQVNVCPDVRRSVLHGPSSICLSCGTNRRQLLYGVRITGSSGVSTYGLLQGSGSYAWHLFTYLDNTDDFDGTTQQIILPWRGQDTAHWVQESSDSQDTDYGYVDSSTDDYNLDSAATFYNVAMVMPS